MQGRGLLLGLAVAATACSPVVTDHRTLAPAQTVAPATAATSSPTPTPSATPQTTVAANATPVARTISGRATLTTSGAGVPGVQVRGMPMPINDGREPGPNVTATTDERGAYTFTVLTWTPEALANSSSFQMMVQVTPPPGLLVLGVTKTSAGPPGSASGNMTGALIVDDVTGPIDITLGPGHIVEGKITSGVTGAPLAGIGVSALGLNSMLVHGGAGDAFEVAATALTDTTGRYRLTVPSGTYVIYTSGNVVVHTSGQQGGASRFWSDDPAGFQASPLRVERDVAGIDLVVVQVTQIGGYVRSGPTFGDGVEGARVAA